jgi:hypothetical protein
MDIATGLGIAKTSLDLIKGIREDLKKKTLSNEEILGYFSDLQERIVDIKTALSDADDERRILQARIEELLRYADLGEGFKSAHGVYWHEDFPNCPTCSDVDRKPVRLGGPTRIPGGGPIDHWKCPFHQTDFTMRWGSKPDQ